VADHATTAATVRPAALRRGPIDTAGLVASVADVTAGATVLFVGTARGVTAGILTESLHYDAHAPLALAVLERLRTEAVAVFGLVACVVEHRLGEVVVGDASVAIAASAPHRRAAFAAAEWLMDRIKREVPIWKCERFVDGRREWVHPGAVPGSEAGR